MERGARSKRDLPLAAPGGTSVAAKPTSIPSSRPHVRDLAVRLVDAAVGGLDPQLRRADRKLGERAVERQCERPGSLDHPRQFQQVLNVAERRRL